MDMYSSSKTGSDLVDLVHHQVTQTPDAVAVVYDDDSEAASVSITYLEMWDRATHVSVLLLLLHFYCLLSLSTYFMYKL